jgi:L,D-transpeptidase catalytic domain
VNGWGRIRFVLPCLALGALLALPAGASAANKSAAAPPITVSVKGHKPASVLQKVRIQGILADPGPNKTVTIRVRNEGRPLLTRKVDPRDGTGAFRMLLTIRACCDYVIVAQQGDFSSRPAEFHVKVPNGVGKGAQAKLFNSLLKDEGFHVAGTPKSKNWATDLAILAFRKTNNMSRNSRFSKEIFRMLLQGKGAFKPKYTEGRHVEVDISRQVMALIVGDKAVHTVHVSTGASATPTIRGKFHFYMRQPGYNDHAMYYSVYFQGGYATHGYDPVPTYNASHGCVRNPIPFSRFIYGWVRLGMPIYVYG